MAERIKITYATLRADNEEMHSGFEEAVTRVRAGLGGHHRNYVGGEWRDAEANFDVRSPIDRDLVLGTFAQGTTADIDDAVTAARQAQPAWAATPWKERIEILRRAWGSQADPLHATFGSPVPFNTRAIIDATRPYEHRDVFPPVAELSPDLRTRLQAKFAALLTD